MYLIMLGAQGTGKGTVAGILAKETGWPQISTGDIFRANISNNTELGIKANEYISKGQLVPDDITVPMVINRLSEDDCKDGAILDGFPRTVEQAEKLDEILAEKSKKVDLVINLITVSLGYPWAKKKFKKSVKRTPLMEETYIGRVMKAEEDIIEKAKVKVDGIYWTVLNKGEEIKRGENFEIIGIEGIKLIIKKEEEI